MADKVGIAEILNAMADKARCDGAPPPVIETDFASARVLAHFLMEELGCRADDLIPGGALGWPYIVQFDGVKIKVRSISPEELYRQHFGALAEIWD